MTTEDNARYYRVYRALGGQYCTGVPLKTSRSKSGGLFCNQLYAIRVRMKDGSKPPDLNGNLLSTRLF